MPGLLFQMILDDDRKVSLTSMAGMTVINSFPAEMTIGDIAEALVKIMAEYRKPAVVFFDGIAIAANPDDTPTEIIANFEEAKASQ